MNDKKMIHTAEKIISHIQKWLINEYRLTVDINDRYIDSGLIDSLDLINLIVFMQIIAANKKIFHDYLIGDKFEAGLVLTGPEVKSLRINTGSIKESYTVEKDGELWLTNCYIKKYSSSKQAESNTIRERKILVNKKELNRIIRASKREGMTVVPIKLYFNDKGFVKLTIALAKGKKKQDKRASIKDREWGINKQRLIKNRSL